MELQLDTEQFDKLQRLFIRQLTETIVIKLRESGLSDKQLEDATANLAFSIASVIDDTSGIVIDGVEVRPYLTFRVDNDEIIHSGDNSEMHEFVFGNMKRLFSS